jgi:hypothetical protein
MRVTAAVFAIVSVLAGCSRSEPNDPVGTAGESEPPAQTTGETPVTLPGLTREQRQAFERIAVSSARAERDARTLADDPRAVAEMRACGTGIGASQLIITGEVEVGPLLLNFLATFGSNRGNYEPVGGEKVIVVIQPGHDATVVIGERHREHAALGYTSSPAPAVTFRGCEHAGAVFNGGITVAGARCLTLDVYVDDQREPEEVVASFGAGRCPT